MCSSLFLLRMPDLVAYNGTKTEINDLPKNKLGENMLGIRKKDTQISSCRYSNNSTKTYMEPYWTRNQAERKIDRVS